MKTFIILILLIGSFQLIQAQDKPNLVFHNGKLKDAQNPISMKEAMKLMENYPEAYAHMKKARTNSTFAGIFAGVGGYFIGYPLGQSIAGGDANWGMAGIGAGFILVALPFNSAMKKNINMAIDLYNKDDYKALNSNVQLNIGLLENGIGLRVSF